jgi:hypothetical protein
MNRCPKCLEEVDVFGAHDRPIYIWEWQGVTSTALFVLTGFVTLTRVISDVSV